MNHRVAPAAVLALVALPLAAAAQDRVQPGERVELPEARVEIFNAVGTVALHHAPGSAVTVTATAQGAEAGRLAFEADHQGSLGRFRVVYPDVDRIAAPAEIGRGGSDIELRPDGTFGGGRDGRKGGKRVRIEGDSGLQAWAALEVGVPDGAEVRVHLAAGRATAVGVNGTVTIDAWSAKTEATNVAGDWTFDSGSGNVVVRGVRGTVRADTGSGDVSFSDVHGDRLEADTGSGGVEATDVEVGHFNFDTGSGDVSVTNLVASEGTVDTGSGNATVVFSGGTIDDMDFDTGSGNVRLTLPSAVDARFFISTGAGDVRVERGDAVFERRHDDDMEVVFGQGRGRVRIDTGSGNVLIR
jgi:DUF4097 and DUF4098 domain-containing protein YvlB